MKLPPPLESAVFVRSAFERLQELGYASASVFAEQSEVQHLILQEDPVADLRVVLGVFEHVARVSRNDLFGLDLAQHTDLREAGVLGYLALCAADVTGFWTSMSDFALLLGGRAYFDVTQLRQDGQITWGHTDLSEPNLGAQYHQFLAALTLTTLRRATQRHIVLHKVAFCHSRRSGTSRLDEFFGCPVTYDAPSCQMVFSRPDLSLALVTADPRLERILTACALGRAGRAAAMREDLQDRVRQRLALRLGSGRASLETVSKDLGMSSRTLSRKLDDLGTSYFQILETLRDEMAHKYLKETDLGLAQIAHLLGYRSLSSFNEAFKRWTGHSPGRFRSKK